MRKRYKEHAIVSGGRFMTLAVYPELAKYKQGKRKSKFRPTPPSQVKINEKNKKWRLIHLCNENFTSADLKIELTYDNDHHPEDITAAQNDFKNYIRRVNRLRKKKGLPAAKYFQVLEKGSRKGRFHHHVIMSGGVSAVELDELWGKGITRQTVLHIDKQKGLEAIVSYMLKKTVREDRKSSYSVSRNMKKTDKPVDHVGRIRQKDVNRITSYTDSGIIERLYPGFELVKDVDEENPQIYYNEEFGQYFLFFQLFRKEEKNVKKRRDKNQNTSGTQDS